MDPKTLLVIGDILLFLILIVLLFIASGRRMT